VLNWRSLNEQLPKLTEDAVKALLAQECDGMRRATIMVRLHQRYTALRASRERQELLSDTKPRAV
jgi:hypothetical protein